MARSSRLEDSGRKGPRASASRLEVGQNTGLIPFTSSTGTVLVLKEKIDQARLLLNEVNALYVQHGIETAVDDVSGSWLDPAIVKRGHDVEMTFFEKVQVYERVPRSDQLKTQGR